ncbi:MAG: transposase [bacterium]|nr:transposase [bacterium]
MSNYRRWFVPGGTYFFTVVTYRRSPLFWDSSARIILREAFSKIQENYPFEQLACVLLPDHFHCLWTLPAGDARYSMRLKRIKEEFTKNWLKHGGYHAEVTDAQAFRGERGVWQPRYWEHVIEDEWDLEAHFDYIHFNPLKHGLVESVRDWQWSTFHSYCDWHYPPGWGMTEPTTYSHIDDFGEPEGF